MTQTSNVIYSRRLQFRLAGLVLLAFACTASAADPQTPEFGHDLFDSRSLDGWTAENGCEAAVDDGLLVLKAGDGWLRSDHTYTDFTMHIEWKALKSDSYDSGIYIRTL